jgi:hypothetical protein
MRLKKGIVRLGDEPLEKDTEVEIIDVSEYELKWIPSKTWRECIKKIWEVDPLICPKCGGEMIKISAFNLHRGKHIQRCILKTILSNGLIIPKLKITGKNLAC